MNCIQETILNHPEYTRNKIKNKCSKEYSWLYKHFKEELYLNLPNPVEHKIYEEQRVNWESRDYMYAELIKKEIESLQDIRERVTKTYILKRCGIDSTYYRNIEKLPRTKKILDDYIVFLRK